MNWRAFFGVRPYVAWGALDNNHHEWRKVDGEWKGFTVHGPKLKFVVLGRDCWNITEGRKHFALRLWFYAKSGACFSVDIGILFKECPYKSGKYAPRPAPDGAVQL